MKDFFKPKDFDPGSGPADDGQELCSYNWAASRANAKLNAEIKTWPVVTGQVIGQGTVLRFFGNEPNNETDTHTARLACIEKIKPKECEHDPVVKIDTCGRWWAYCKGCDVVLRPTKWVATE